MAISVQLEILKIHQKRSRIKSILQFPRYNRHQPCTKTPPGKELKRNPCLLFVKGKNFFVVTFPVLIIKILYDHITFREKKKMVICAGVACKKDTNRHSKFGDHCGSSDMSRHKPPFTIYIPNESRYH